MKLVNAQQQQFDMSTAIKYLTVSYLLHDRATVGRNSTSR